MITGLTKMEIQGFADLKRQRKIGTWTAMFNPQHYRQQFQVDYAKPQGINTSGKALSYTLTPPSLLSFTLLVDGTTDKVNGSGKSVAKHVEELLNLTKNMNGDIHQPNYLTVKWADLSLQCRLQSLDIRYTLFAQSGQPLRAELDVSFIEDSPEMERLARENKSSPDLTHELIIQAGDKLPTIAYQVYGNTRYYQHLARFNELNQSGELTVGSTLVCPPIDELQQYDPFSSFTSQEWQ